MTVPRILSTGFYVPGKILTNTELATRVDTSDDWIYSHTGIRERRIAAADQAGLAMVFTGQRHFKH